MKPRFWVLAAALALACEPAGTDNIIEIGGGGTVLGIVFVDANASGTFESTDTPARLLSVALVSAGTSDTVARVRTDENGAFSFALVPVGNYEVVAADGALGDTMNIVFRDPPGLPVGQIGPEDSTTITVGDQDSVHVRIGVSYPIVDVETARTLPAGRRVFVRAVAVAGTGSAADSTIFVEGTTRGIAVRRTTSVASAGDSLLVFGTTGTRDGQPVITDASATVLASDIAYDTIHLVAATAANAGGGVHDARLVHVADLLATDTTRTSQRFVITAEDPSGSVLVSVPLAMIRPEYVPGMQFSVTGVLVPRSGVAGAWQIRPRVLDDIEATGP